MWPLVHVAQTARRQSHSSFVARLKETERADVEEENEWNAPYDWGMDDHQQSRDDKPGAERYYSEGEPLAPLSCTNVGDPYCG